MQASDLLKNQLKSIVYLLLNRAFILLSLQFSIFMCFDFMVFLGEDRTTIRRQIFKFMFDNLDKKKKRILNWLLQI